MTRMDSARHFFFHLRLPTHNGSLRMRAATGVLLMGWIWQDFVGSGLLRTNSDRGSFLQRNTTFAEPIVRGKEYANSARGAAKIWCG